MHISDWSSDVCSSDLRDARCLSEQVMRHPASLRREVCASPIIAPRLRIRRYSADALSSAPSLAGTVTSSSVPMAASSEVASLVVRSEEHTSELQSLMRISYAVFCLKKKT